MWRKLSLDHHHHHQATQILIWFRDSYRSGCSQGGRHPAVVWSRPGPEIIPAQYWAQSVRVAGWPGLDWRADSLWLSDHHMQCCPVLSGLGHNSILCFTAKLSRKIKSKILNKTRRDSSHLTAVSADQQDKPLRRRTFSSTEAATPPHLELGLHAAESALATRKMPRNVEVTQHLPQDQGIIQPDFLSFLWGPVTARWAEAKSWL